jgi:soluble lytic murein transglycosylase-like protein
MVLLGLLAVAMPGQALARPPLVEGRPGEDLFRHIGRAEAARNGVPFALLDAVMWVESRYNPRARGGVGEIGLMQVLPTTATLLGFTGSLARLAEPATNIAYGARYLAEAWRLAKGDLCTTVMKYRAGHAQTRFSARSIEYCNRIRAHLARVLGADPPATALYGPVPDPARKQPVAIAGKPSASSATWLAVHTPEVAPIRLARQTLQVDLPDHSVTVAAQAPVQTLASRIPATSEARQALQLASYEVDETSKAGQRASRKNKCFRRVVQPGRRFGACIPRTVLAKKGLLRG